MTIKGLTKLFSGECAISRSGIYTFVHCYRHPINEREVIMVGMNHVGDEKYFAKIKQILSACDLVIFEDVRNESGSNYEAEESMLRKIVFGSSAEESFMFSMQLYFMVAEKLFSQAEKEAEAFDAEYGQAHWFSGDTLLLSENQEQEYVENLECALTVVATDRKRAVVEYIKEAVARIDQGDLHKQDIAEGFIFFYSDTVMARIFLQKFAKPRDLYCFKEFDRLVRERNPGKIGIKFGAGHIANQRSLLEERGYVLQKSRKLCNISFKK